MSTDSKTVADFSPPRWIFATNAAADAMPAYSRSDFDAGPGGRAVLFIRPGDPSLQVARLGQLTAILDGELYDPDKLARDVGVDDADGGDALLLLRCYRERGESFFPRLRGMFTLVIWDAQTATLLCVRDPMGYYPCFFAGQGRDLLVSTSPRLLLEHPNVSRAVNRLELLDYFFDIWGRREETFYQAIKRVSPGHMLKARDGNVIISRYWNPLPLVNGRPLLKEDDAALYPELLERSVKRCLRHSPLGIYLSGGLDSVSVAALASENCRAAGLEPPYALSLVFPFPEYNEEFVQGRVARQLGFPQTFVRLEDAAGPGGLYAASEELNREFSFPVQNIWMPAYNHMALLAKQRGVRAILTGTGGDEWLGVTPFLSADLIRSGRLGALWNFWAANSRTIPLSRPRFALNVLWLFGLRALLREALLGSRGPMAASARRFLVGKRWRKKRPPWLRVEPELWREFVSRVETRESNRRPLGGPYGFYFGEVLRGMDHPIVSWEMEEGFENARRLGMRFLHPFVDADLAELLCSLPPECLLVGGTSKGLARQFLADRFPDLGFEKQKKMVIHRPLPETVMGDWLLVWKQSGRGKGLAGTELVDVNQLETSLGGALRSGDYRDTFRAWQIIGIEHWLRSRI